jgi:hypothetical protein
LVPSHDLFSTLAPLLLLHQLIQRFSHHSTEIHVALLRGALSRRQ